MYYIDLMAWYSASGSIDESAATTGTAFTKWKNESDLYVGTTFDANGRYARMVYRHFMADQRWCSLYK